MDCLPVIISSFTGFEIYFVAMYNFSWTMNGTASDLDYHQLALRGSPQAYVGGIFFFFSFTSSLYHLVFLGQQRLHAIKWPFQYKAQRKRVIYIGICVIWLLSFIAAVSPSKPILLWYLAVWCMLCKMPCIKDKLRGCWTITRRKADTSIKCRTLENTISRSNSGKMLNLFKNSKYKSSNMLYKTMPHCCN